jgi:enamine deaminase RidA (YjgF/YER057c/UK114 family)
MTKIEAKLKQMGYELPKVPMDMKYWARCKRAGNLIFMGTTGPWPIVNKTVKGKLQGVIGKDVTVEEAKFTCKMSVLSILAALKNELGDLDKIDKIVKLEIYLNGPSGDADPYVAIADAASELFIELFGENGRATRTVTPNITNIVAELDMVVSVKD